MKVVNDKNPPLVSIIVPVFNGEKYLRESLDSIVAQTYPNVEILVMDDASTDSTPEIIASYGDGVRHVRQNSNKGQFANVNDGISVARGKYIAIYHADDVYDPRIVEREVSFLEQFEQAGAVFCYDIFINGEGMEYGRLSVPEEFRDESCLNYPSVLNGILKYKNRFLPTPGAMVRSAVYEEIGVFRGEKFQIASDLEMWLRIARKYEIGLIHEHFFSYRHGHENSSQAYFRLRTETEKQFVILDKFLAAGGRALATPDAIRAYEAHRAEDILMIAVNNYILGRKSAAAACLDEVRFRNLLNSRKIQRGRLTFLFLILQVLTRVPQIKWVADLFYRRWHMKTYPA